MPDSSWGQVTIRIPAKAPVTAQAKVGAFDVPEEIQDAPVIREFLRIVRDGGTLRIEQADRAGGCVFGMESHEWLGLFPGCQLEFKWDCCPGAYPAGGEIWHLGKLVASFAHTEFDPQKPGRLQNLIKGGRHPKTNHLHNEMLAAKPALKVPENFMELSF
jgi:hypothetical protein